MGKPDTGTSDHCRPESEVNRAAVAMLNKEGVFTRWGKDCEEMFGRCADEMVGNFTPENLAVESYELNDFLDAAKREGRVHREVMVLNGEGEPFLGHESILHMPAGERGTSAYVYCIVDVTPAKRREEDLCRERNRLDALVEAMGGGLALFDADMKLQWANERLRSWFDVERIYGQGCCEVFAREGAGSTVCPLKRIDGENVPFNTTTEHVDEKGQWRCFLHVVTEADIGHHRYLVLTTDITHQRRQKEQVQLVDRLSECLQGSLNLDRILYLTLMCVTAGHALGFSRAFILLIESDTGRLKGVRGGGPISEQTAERIWAHIGEEEGGEWEEWEEETTLNGGSETGLTKKVRDLDIPVGGLCERVLESRKPYVVQGADKNPVLHKDLCNRLDLDECVLVPLVSGDTPVGIMIADNKVSGRPVDEEGVEQLQVFATQASMAIANARAYTKLQEKVEQLHKTRSKLVESERLASVGRMAAQMAHQMRTPLASIGGYSRAIMRSAPEESTIYRNAKIIYEEEQNLEAEVNETLELSRPIKPNRSVTDFNKLVRETVDRFFCDGARQEMQLSVSLDEGVPDVAVDSALIQQVINNLLENARQAVQDQPKQRIRVRTRCSPDYVELLISDTGEGMDGETREKIFAPFFTTKKGGTGLGLAIARRIVRKHDGELWCRTRRGKGTTFGVKLPL